MFNGCTLHSGLPKNSDFEFAVLETFGIDEEINS